MFTGFIKCDCNGVCIEVNPFICTTTSSSTTTTTTTAAPIIIPSSVLFLTGDTPRNIYAYDPGTNTSVLLTIPDIDFIYATDIAHTPNKLWLITDNVYEWDIISSPFSAVFNRVITNVPLSSGLGAINDTTLVGISRPTFLSSAQVFECDIAGTISVNTFKFSLIAGRFIAGDYLLTTTGKLITTTFGNDGVYVTQYNYSTGIVEMDVNISATIPSPYGLYQYGTEIYIANGGGELYQIDKTTPYALTLVDTVDYSIFGASQIPAYLTNHFVGTTTTTSTTIACNRWQYAYVSYTCTSCTPIEFNSFYNSNPLTLENFYQYGDIVITPYAYLGCDTGISDASIPDIGFKACEEIDCTSTTTTTRKPINCRTYFLQSPADEGGGSWSAFDCLGEPLGGVIPENGTIVTGCIDGDTLDIINGSIKDSFPC